MVPAVPGAEGMFSLAAPDPDPDRWVAALTGPGPDREAALTRLHELMLRIARAELRRRGGRWRITGPDRDDLAYQAAADALVALLGKVGQFRGESRFTTWAAAFVVREVSATLGRYFRRQPAAVMDAEDWDNLPARLGLEPGAEAERRELAQAVRRAVHEHLPARQRRVFVALVLNGVPLDALAAELGTTRGAIYKSMFDARRKLRAALAAAGYLGGDTARRT